MILVLAWSLADVTGDVGIAWGPMAIVIPLAILGDQCSPILDPVSQMFDLSRYNK